MDQHRSELHTSNWRMGRLIADSGVKVFQIETTLNTDTFPAPDALPRAPGMGMVGCATGPPSWPPRPPWPARRTAWPDRSSTPCARPTNSRACRPARWKPCTPRRPRTSTAQQLVAVEGQTDILTLGLPYICPYNVNSIMNPILVACLGLGYFFNMYKGRPLVREGGVVIMSHPTPWAFHPGHHPSYIDFFEQVLSETTDPAEIGQVRGGLRHRPVVRPPLPDRQRLSRRPSLLHVVLVRPRPRTPRWW
jgi:hypothetical protein